VAANCWEHFYSNPNSTVQHGKGEDEERVSVIVFVHLRGVEVVIGAGDKAYKM
jgi:hypothetical protein